MISIDSETTGIDFRHGAKPFLVTICKEDGEQLLWEFDVDPYTREPLVPKDDIHEIFQTITPTSGRSTPNPWLVLQNSKFDVTALEIVDIKNWPWFRTHDTLIAGHLLASNKPHNLTDMAIQYLDIDIEPYEKKLEEAVKAARRYAHSHYPDWMIAKEGLSCMPSAKEKTWKYDTWLPRMICVLENRSGDDPWWTVTSEYANVDSATTLALWKVMEQEVKRRGLWEIYLERLKVLPAAYRMEQNGVTISKRKTRELRAKFADTSEACHKKCVELSGGTLTKLPVNGVSNELKETIFGKLGLVSSKETDKGNPSMDKYVLEEWLNTTDPSSDAHQFILNLQYYRKRQTALGYIESYEKYQKPLNGKVDINEAKSNEDTFLLYPSYNVTGTRLLRGSMTNPNGQQISKQNLVEMGTLEKGKNVRYTFGPEPGYEWYSMDGQNIELRIPAYLADETDLIYVFEHSNDPPYYGSYHLMVCDLLYPEEFKRIGGKQFKVEYEDTYYQWVKNGNFAMQYGAQEEKTDSTFRVAGAYNLIGQRFSKIRKLGDRMKALANRTGGIETAPDKTVNPNRGYPLECRLTDYGSVMPTTPLSYFVQGTAGWWINKAMIRCDMQIEEWRRREDKRSRMIALILQVHDELVFKFPRGEGKEPWRTNLPKVRRLQHLMQLGGEDIGVPTPVSVEYHADNWSEGKVL